MHGADELPGNQNACEILADLGYQIQLLPTLPAQETDLRAKLLPDVFGSKNPDVRINGKWIGDIKTPAADIAIRKSTINNDIASAAKQKVQIAIINLTGREYTIQDIKKGIVGALQPDRNKSIEQVWIITKNKNLFIAERNDVFNDAIYDKLDLL